MVLGLLSYYCRYLCINYWKCWTYYNDEKLKGLTYHTNMFNDSLKQEQLNVLILRELQSKNYC